MPPPDSESSYLVSRRVLLDAREGFELKPALLVVSGQRLVRVEAFADDKALEASLTRLQQQGTFVRDFGDRPLTPAFVNAHTHIALNFLRAFAVPQVASGNTVEDLFYRVEKKLEPGDVRAFARLGAYENLLHGVATVWDHYYHGLEVANALVDTGLTGVVAPTLQDVAGPGKDRWQAELDATESLTAGSWSARGVFGAVGPHASDTVSAALWRRAADLAARLELPLHAHLAQSIQEYERAMERHGVSPVRWLESQGLLQESTALWVHCLYTSRGDLSLFDATRHTLIFCPCSQVIFGFPANVLAWSDAGLSWTVGTDTSATNDSMNLQKELRFVAGLRTQAMPWSDAVVAFERNDDLESARCVWRQRQHLFAAATPLAEPQALLRRAWTVAGSLHPRFKTGTLATGAVANLIVWESSHPAFWPCDDQTTLLELLVMGDTTAAIHALFANGREIGQGGDFHRSLVQSTAFRDAMTEADERLEKLRQRL